MRQEHLRWNYRNKVCLHARWREDRWALGLLRRTRFQKKHEAELIEIPNCPIHSVHIQKILTALMSQLPPGPDLPLVFVTVSGTLLTLVLKMKNLPAAFSDFDWNLFVHKNNLNLTGIFMNLNPSAGDRVYSHKGWRLVWGRARGGERSAVYGPDSFQQLIPELHEHAMGEAQTFLSPGGGDAVLDLYSGTGESLRRWEQTGAFFQGVELGGSAWECAVENLDPASHSRGAILRGRVSERLPQLEQWLAEVSPKQVYVYVNPPRLGLEAEVLQWLVEKAQPRRMAYLSCNPVSLARDLSVLTHEGGYSVKNVLPYDFFPQTHPIETLSLLEKAGGAKPAPCF